jgi:Protein of unknown function (DUF2845)
VAFDEAIILVLRRVQDYDLRENSRAGFAGKPWSGKVYQMKVVVAVCIAMLIGSWAGDLTSPAYAMRCGSRIIAEGDPREKVLNECGPPSDVESWEEERYDYFDRPPHPRYHKEFERYGNSYRVRAFIRVELWTYNYGPSRFVDYVRIENGQVRQVYSGSYGY